jgi:hypothetical protein
MKKRVITIAIALCAVCGAGGPWGHLALAEQNGYDVLLTVDKPLISAANRSDARIEVLNPILWLAEVLKKWQ